MVARNESGSRLLARITHPFRRNCKRMGHPLYLLGDGGGDQGLGFGLDLL
jgi:hypothetical protein